MSTKDNSCELAVRYLGRISLALVIGVTLCFLAVIGLQYIYFNYARKN